MCGKCSEYNVFSAKENEVRSFKHNLVIVVLFSLTCSALGISCYSVLRVQSLSEDLNILRIVLSKNELTSSSRDGNHFSVHQNQADNSGRPNDQRSTFGGVDQERGQFRERAKRSPNEASQLVTNSPGDNILPGQSPEENSGQTLHSIKKKAVDYEENVETETFSPAQRTIYTHRHRAKNNNQLEIIDEYSPQAGRLKSLIATHYNGDTSKYVYGHHSNFNGNGHLRHPQKTFVDWKESDWVGSIGTGTNFVFNDGRVTIRESGLYFVYSQIYYLDQHDMNGYRVYRNSDILLQCTTTSHSSERMMKGNTCYTASVTYLDTNDTISVSDITDGRYSLFEPGKSFFGMIKLGDAKIK